MGRSCLFHLYLYLTVTRIDIVELLHSRGSRISLFLRIEFLADMEKLSVATQEESEGIESCMLIVALAGLHGKGVEQRRLDEQQ